MKGAFRLMLAIAVVTLAGCQTKPKFSAQEVQELRDQLAQCTVRLGETAVKPHGGRAIVRMTLVEGGRLDEVSVSYLTQGNDARFGNATAKMISACQPFDTPVVGKVFLPMMFK